MPPKQGYKAFKPPKPLSRTPSASKTSTKKGKQTQPESISSDAEEPARNDEDGSDDSDLVMQEPVKKRRETEEPAAIPPKLLSRLLHEHFQKEDTRITKEAMSVFAKYVETFANEAVVRANAEREEAATKDSSVDAGFLEVEDLEKMAPQLLMDF